MFATILRFEKNVKAKKRNVCRKKKILNKIVNTLILTLNINVIKIVLLIVFFVFFSCVTNLTNVKKLFFFVSKSYFSRIFYIKLFSFVIFLTSILFLILTLLLL